MIAAILNKRLASYRDIEEYLGMGDIWDLYELIAVQAYNSQLAQEDR